MLRNTDIWIRAYLVQMLLSRFRRRAAAAHVIFCFVDHFEPLWREASEESGMERIAKWIEGYEAAAPLFSDSDGRFPRHSYFFPLEQYRERFLNALASHCRKGFGEVEIHLHHDNDTSQSLRETLERSKSVFARHGLLGVDASGGRRYGFIHGDWALDNSHPQGRFCGVNDELSVLRDTGCYADFTLPSAPSPTQTSTINSIYYAIDDPRRPKSHDTGIPVKVGGKDPARGKAIMIVQGPLMLDWRRRRHGVFPRTENAEISGSNPPTKQRLRLWIEAGVAVIGKPDWIFVKVHTHGCIDSAREGLFEAGGFHELHAGLRKLLERNGIEAYHYATAREMYNIIKAAEAGERGSPFDFRDYLVAAPKYGGAAAK